MLYVRYESPSRDTRGRYLGVFALANTLARSGALSTADVVWWRAENDWLDEAYPDPGTFDATLFDPVLHAAVSCWFKITARHVLDRVPGYLDLLDRYGVACSARISPNPGKTLYEDEVQIVCLQ